MKVGLVKTNILTVTKALTAKQVGSGTLDVYATPAMIALMEQTAAESVEAEVGEGKTTVGTKLNVEHLSATPIGMEVTCKSELAEVDGRRLVFKIEVYDEAGIIGRADHERFVVDAERFISKTYGKLTK